MVASTISRVEGDEEAIRTLTWLGGSFFEDIRLAQFTLDTWAQMSSPDAVDWASSGPLAKPRVEVWSILGNYQEIIGAMTLHFSGWARLRQQRYFSATESSADTQHICVRRFDRLVAGATGSISPFVAAVELGYFAVDPALRGLGLGRTLFDIFLHRASTVAAGRTLAFTIVMSKHAHSHCGSSLMSHLIDRGANDPRSAMSLDAVDQRLSLPADLFTVEPAAYPTAHMARQRGFRFAGFGRNLGQVWVREQDPAMRLSVTEEQLITPIDSWSQATAAELPVLAAL